MMTVKKTIYFIIVTLSKLTAISHAAHKVDACSTVLCVKRGPKLLGIIAIKIRNVNHQTALEIDVS